MGKVGLAVLAGAIAVVACTPAAGAPASTQPQPATSSATVRPRPVETARPTATAMPTTLGKPIPTSSSARGTTRQVLIGGSSGLARQPA